MIKEKINTKIYFNAKGGGLERYYTDTKEKKLFGEVGGLITDLRIVEKDDFDKKNKVKELQLEMYDEDEKGKPEYYVICSRLHRSFSDGLLLTLANIPDLSKKVIVRGYTVPPKEVNPTFKPATFCSVRMYENAEKKLEWLAGCPETKTVTYKGQDIRDREERDAFLEGLIEDIKVKIRNNSASIKPVLTQVPDEVYSGEAEEPED